MVMATTTNAMGRESSLNRVESSSNLRVFHKGTPPLHMVMTRFPRIDEPSLIQGHLPQVKKAPLNKALENISANQGNLFDLVVFSLGLKENPFTCGLNKYFLNANVAPEERNFSKNLPFPSGIDKWTSHQHQLVVAVGKIYDCS